MTSNFGKTACALATLLISTIANTPAFAQGALTPGSTFSQNHPRRYQVLTGDQNLQSQINQDYGHLDGQYPNLVNQSNNIWSQEEQDAQQNGGYITRAQWAQLDSQEASLQSSINSDLAAGSANGQNSNPWPDYNGGSSSTASQSGSQQSGQYASSTLPQTSYGQTAIQGGYTGQACGWAGSGGFSGGLPPTSTSLVDLNVVY